MMQSSRKAIGKRLTKLSLGWFAIKLSAMAFAKRLRIAITSSRMNHTTRIRRFSDIESARNCSMTIESDIATCKFGFGKDRLTSTLSKKFRTVDSTLTKLKPAEVNRGSGVRISLDPQKNSRSNGHFEVRKDDEMAVFLCESTVRSACMRVKRSAACRAKRARRGR